VNNSVTFGNELNVSNAAAYWRSRAMSIAGLNFPYDLPIELLGVEFSLDTLSLFKKGE
jgi:hypothetical protein